MEDALLAAYGRTTFVANTPRGRLSLRVGRRSAELDALLAAHDVATWAYVTAFNPGSRLLPAEANAARQRELERVVAARGFASYPGEGIGDDGRWPPERSLLVLGIGRTDAMQLGRKFGQLAIVYGELGTGSGVDRLRWEPRGVSRRWESKRMTWFLRKSIRLGPLRLNLSKRGIGASVGVKGLRAGVDASGKPYVTGGRGGVYFRERIRGTETERTRPGAPRSGSTRLAWTVAIVLAIIVLLLIFTR